MKNLFAIVLLVTAMAAIGCEKKPAPSTTPAPPVENKPADGGAAPATTPPADAPK